MSHSRSHREERGSLDRRSKFVANQSSLRSSSESPIIQLLSLCVSMLRHLSRIVCSIFNDRASSDLIVIVSGREHHLHRSIMIPTSHYLERFLTWSEEHAVIPTIKIDLPDVDVPDPFRTSSNVHDDWFALFVRVVY